MPDYSQSPYTDQLAGVIARLMREGLLEPQQLPKPPAISIVDFPVSYEKSKIVAFSGDRVVVLGDSYGRVNLEFSNGVRIPNVKPGTKISMPYDFVKINSGYNFADAVGGNVRLVLLSGAASYDEQYAPSAVTLNADLLGESYVTGGGYTDVALGTVDPPAAGSFQVNGVSKIRLLMYTDADSFEIVPFFMFIEPGINARDESGDVAPIGSVGSDTSGAYYNWYEDSASLIVVPAVKAAYGGASHRVATLNLAAPTYALCYLKVQNLVNGTFVRAIAQAIG